jgi:hypothetical protein
MFESPSFAPGTTKGKGIEFSNILRTNAKETKIPIKVIFFVSNFFI